MLNLLERERFVVARVELGGVVRDCLTVQEFDPPVMDRSWGSWFGARESVTSFQSVLLPGELGSCRQSVRFGSSSTVSPADVTDDRSP